MANFLECNDRTNYRYIDLLKQLGFDIQKDEHNKFFILSDKETDEHFTKDAGYLIEMVKPQVKKTNCNKQFLRKSI